MAQRGLSFSYGGPPAPTSGVQGLAEAQALANLLAAPARIQNQSQQSALDRAVLMKLGIPEAEARVMVPDPGPTLPGGIAGKALSGLGTFGSVLSTILGAPIAAPRVKMGPLVQALGMERAQKAEEESTRRWEKSVGFQEENLKLSKAANARAEAASVRQEAAEGRYQKEFDRQEARQNVADERAARAEGRADKYLQMAERQQTPSQVAAAKRKERLHIARKLFDLTDPQVAAWAYTGKAGPHRDKAAKIEAELDARQSGGSAYPTLFGRKGEPGYVPDEKLRELWQNDTTSTFEKEIARLTALGEAGRTGPTGVPKGYKLLPAGPTE